MALDSGFEAESLSFALLTGVGDFTKLFGDNPCQFRGVFAGKVDNLKLLLRRYPDLACKINQFGTSACHFACMLSVDQGQKDILKE